MKKLKNTNKITHQEWLDLRRKGIGGSDIGAILGYNKYSSAFSVWAEKTGRKSPIKDNEAMRQGRDLEQYVAERFCEATGKKVRRSNYIYQHPKHPYMIANIDRLVVGEDAGLECKTCNIYGKKIYTKDDIPESYYCQCMHYMAVTGLSRWYLAVLVLGDGLYWFTLERDENNIKLIEEACKNFWGLVENDTPPMLDGSESTSIVINNMYTGDDEKKKELSINHNEKIDKIMELKQEKEKIDQEIKQLENEIKLEIEEAQEAYTNIYKITWKPQSRLNLDRKKLKQEHPDIYDAYTTQTDTRVFKIQKIGV